MSEGLSFVHRFERGADPKAPPLLLLHGTGGDENDLVPLGRTIAPNASLVSPRGKVLEDGMPRFFRRFADGTFDEADVRSRAHELADFIAAAVTRYALSPPIALGYSNGANVAAAVLLLRPEMLAGAILLRATVPLAHAPSVDSTGKSILIVSGIDDPIIPPANAARLAVLLQRNGAAVEHHTLPSGHALSQADIVLAKRWLAARGAA